MAETNTAASFGNEFSYFSIPRIVICLLGAASNVLLLVAFIKDPLRCFRNSGTYLVMNLSVCDCLTCLLSLNFFFTPRTVLHPIPIFFFNWIGCMSFVSITSISVDRFLIVVYPMKYRILMKGKVMFIWIAAISTVSSVIPIFILLSDDDGTGGRTGQALHVFSVIVITLSSVMYSFTYYKLKKQSRNIALQNSIESRAQEIRILKEKRFLKTIIIVACIAFVSTVPYLVLSLLNSYVGFLAKNLLVLTISYTVCAYIVLINFAANPLIYILRLPNYRKTFYLLYCRRVTAFSRY